MRQSLRLAVPLAVGLCLMLPSMALAETMTVDAADTNDTCARGGADTTCKTIAAAVSAAQGGDTVKILKGTYSEAVSISGKDALKIEGSSLADVKITGSGTSDVVTIASNDVTLSGVSIDVPINAGSALLVSGTGAIVQSVVLTRATASDVNDPVLDVTGTATLSKATISQNAGAVGTPAVRSTGAGTVLSDSLIFGLRGPCTTFSSGEGNKLVRSILVSTEIASNAIELTSVATSTTNKKLLVDSTVVIGGANAAGLLAKTSGADTGDLTVDLRHVTIAASAKGIVLDATEAQGPAGPIPTPANPAGNITATVNSSIVHGASTANAHKPAFPASLQTAPNVVKLTYTNSDAPTATGNGEIAMNGASNTPDEKLFVKNKLSLRADAPVIDKGSAPAPDDSATDFEGEPRVAGAASDIGADEFTNKPPVAKFGITSANPRAGEPVGYGSLSTDPEIGSGGGLKEYRWDFGDGARETTTVAGVAHTYATPGTYQATLTVVDVGGLASAPTAPQTITVRDGKPVDLKVASPVVGAKLTLNPLPAKPKKGSKKKPKIPKALVLNALGTAADESGVKEVQVALVLTKRSTIPKLLRPAFKKATTAATTCEHYIGSKGFERRPCDKVTYFVARLKDADWQFNTSKKLRLPPGSYELLVRAADGSDLVTVPTAKADTLVKFTVK